MQVQDHKRSSTDALMGDGVFTSESVTEGHPDKVADQISDAILDELIGQDPGSRVACETLVKTGMAVIAGEITTKGYVDMPQVARRTIRDIGYTSSSMGFDWETCAVLTAIERQSPDIAQGVDRQAEPGEQGAGDQGMMFGYACDETPALMPAPIHYAHRLAECLSRARKSGEAPFLRPDGKTQVSLRYRNGRPLCIETVVVSCQHTPEVSNKTLNEAVHALVLERVLPKELVSRDMKVWINPTGRFVIGGPMGDAGLTGRKIIVDTYGGMGRHGGGAFSGKDPSKVDRSAAYYARYIAKSVVAARLAARCEVQLAYAIGVAQPVSMLVNTFGTGAVDDGALGQAIARLFPARPRDIISALKLCEPRYLPCASYGHFGREGESFTWENVRSKAEELGQMFAKQARG